MLKVRPEAMSTDVRQIRLKIWPASETEPVAWMLSAPVASRAGSILLIAHHTGVTFGRLRASPL